jgi:hypothetical protein
LLKVANAVRFGEEPAAVEGIDVNGFGWGLEATDEVARHGDAGDGKAEPAGEAEVKEAEADGIAGATVDDAVEVAILGVVIVGFIAAEGEFVEEIPIQAEQGFAVGVGGVDSGMEIGGVAIEEGLVGGGIDVGISGEGEEPGGFFDIEILSLIQAKREKPVVGSLAVEVVEDFLDAAAGQGIGAEGVGSQPGIIGRGEDFLTDGLIDRGILVREELDQGDLLAIGDLCVAGCGGGRAHV